jgi:hypothetical protein
VADEADTSVKSAGLPIHPVVHCAPVFESHRKKVPHTMV